MVFFLYFASLIISLIFSFFPFFKRKQKELFIFLLCLLTVLRFDVGPDYEDTYNLIEGSANIIKYWDTFIFIKPDLVSFSLICIFLKNIGFNSILIFAFFAIVTYLIVYKILKSENQDFISFVVMFSFFGLFFILLDRVRQSVSILIFLYAIKYYSNRRYIKYIIFILLASFFHVSAIFLIFLPLFRHVNVGRNASVIIVVALLLLYYIGGVSFFVEFIYNKIPGYRELYNINLIEGAKKNSGLVAVLYSLVYLFFIRSKKVGSEIRFLLVVGICIFILSAGNLGMVRFSDYFLTIPIFYIKISDLYKNYSQYLFYLLFALFSSLQLFNRVTNPYYSYISIFSNQSHNLEFRLRD